MLKKILVAIDGSDASSKGAEAARELAQKNGSDVTFLEVLAPAALYNLEENARFNYAMAYPDLLEAPLTPESAVDVATAHISAAAQGFAAAGIPYHTKIRTGNPAEEICQEAEQEKTQLIIIGSRGITGINRFLLGSVSAKVISHAPCSVLVTR